MSPAQLDRAWAVATNRFGLGVRGGESVSDGLAAERPAHWLTQQLGWYLPLPEPWAVVPDTVQVMADQAAAARRVRDSDEAQRPQARQQLRQAAQRTYDNAVNARVTTALTTSTPFVERLVHFWSNHFAVSADKPAVTALAGAFERDAIRPNVLGRFEDLLLAAERHPAMLQFLDQVRSVGPDSVGAQRQAGQRQGRAPGLNENLSREILELHTLGARSVFGQDDVTEFARALTGWGVDNGESAAQPDAPGAARADNANRPASRQRAAARIERDSHAPGFVFRPQLHQPGERRLLGKRYPQEGQAQALAILHDLASAEATARHLASQLACHFVADVVPPDLVDRLAQTYLRNGGELVPVYRALIEWPRAWAPEPAKFKTPWDWVISSLRGLDAEDRPNLRPAQWLKQLGQPVWRPGSPAGFDDVAASWAGPDALMRRAEAAQRFAAMLGGRIDARQLAPELLPGTLSQATADEIARAESPRSALALLLMSPEFMRR